MASQLLDQIKDYLTPDLVNSAATHLGESPANITKATSAAVPALLGGFINKAEAGGGAELLSDAKKALGSGLLNNLGGLFGGRDSGVLNMGTSLLSSLFGSKLTTLTSSISNFAGIRNSSVSSLLGMLAPLGLGVLGQHATEHNLSASGLSNWLSSQKNVVMNALPSGLGLSSLFDRSTAGTPRVTAAAPSYEPPPKKNYFLTALLSVAAIALLVFLISRGCKNDNVTATHTDVDTTTTVTAPVTPPVTTTTVESMKVRLANGVEIDAYKGGIEDRLVRCLDDAACHGGKDQWFDFDNINFETGSANLTAESNAQVKNIVAILNAYPNAKIKIGGYTDKTGDAASNKTLSQQRADAVMNAIKAGGAKAGQLVGAEGYGSEFAKIDASASDEERRVDRRIAVQLREK